MAVAQKSGIPKWVARSASGDMDQDLRNFWLILSHTHMLQEQTKSTTTTFVGYLHRFPLPIKSPETQKKKNRFPLPIKSPETQKKTDSSTESDYAVFECTESQMATLASPGAFSFLSAMASPALVLRTVKLHMFQGFHMGILIEWVCFLWS